MILNEKMNPLNIKPERFLVAEEEEEEGKERGQGRNQQQWRKGGEKIVAFGQLAELEPGRLFELRSLVTAPEWRGRGIGAELVKRLLDEAASAKKEGQQRRGESGAAAAEAAEAAAAEVVLTTVSRRRDFYERLGFEEVPPLSSSSSSSSGVPKQLRFEVAVGSVVARLAAGDSLIVLRKKV